MGLDVLLLVKATYFSSVYKSALPYLVQLFVCTSTVSQIRLQCRIITTRMSTDFTIYLSMSLAYSAVRLLRMLRSMPVLYASVYNVSCSPLSSVCLRPWLADTMRVS